MSDDAIIEHPLSQLVYGVILSAHRQNAQFMSVRGGVIMFLVDADWQHEWTLQHEVMVVRFVRRLSVMLGCLMPGPTQVVEGPLVFRTINEQIACLVRVYRDEHHVPAALIEFVDPAELATRTAPREPTTHPFR